MSRLRTQWEVPASGSTLPHAAPLQAGFPQAHHELLGVGKSLSSTVWLTMVLGCPWEMPAKDDFFRAQLSRLAIGDESSLP